MKKYQSGKPYKHKHQIPLTFEELDQDVKERIDRISKEFQNGFRLLDEFEKSVTFFGSARTLGGSKYFKQARKLASKIVRELGYSIITGGGPGIMAAANCGAADAMGKSVGLTIKLPMEQKTNICLSNHMDFQYFFSRKVCLTYAAEAYVYFPGGFGTMDELFEILTLIQTDKIEKVPVILVGKKYWKKWEKFVKNTLLKNKTIDDFDLNLYKITDDEDEIIEIIRNAPIRKSG